jgi:rod shape-determining protein MreD
MKNKLIFLGFILATGLLQVTIFDSFRFYNVKPDLLLITVVIAGLHFDLIWVLAAGLLAGFFKDIFGTNTFGLNALLFTAWGYLIWRANREISIDFFMIRLALVAIVALANGLVNAAALIYFGNIIPLGIMIRSVILNTIYTAALFPLAYKLVKL